MRSIIRWTLARETLGSTVGSIILYIDAIEFDNWSNEFEYQCRDMSGHRFFPGGSTILILVTWGNKYAFDHHINESLLKFPAATYNQPSPLMVVSDSTQYSTDQLQRIKALEVVASLAGGDVISIYRELSAWNEID